MMNSITRMNMNYCKCCNKPCYGLQCVDCDMSIPSDTKSNCSDCFRTFDAMKKNGTIRKRCASCQISFEDLHLKPCSDCSKFFFSRRQDGTFRKRCIVCQDVFVKNALKKCNGCDNNTLKEYAFCKFCVSNSKMEVEAEPKVYKSHKCNNKTCENMTMYRLCSDCNRTANQYMVSVCQYNGCGFRGRGLFKFCMAHK